MKLISSTFLRNDAAVNYIINEGLIPRETVCPNCKHMMCIKPCDDYTQKFVYRCKNNRCKRRYTILFDTVFSQIQIKMKKILTCLYLWIMDLDVAQTTAIADVSVSVFLKLKKCFMKSLIKANKAGAFKIGGPDVCVQVDETAICRGRIITNPSNTLDNIPNTQWLVGIIQENDQKIILKIVPNRTVQTFTELFNEFLLPGTVIKSDGYPSYPSAVSAANCRHIVVNHSEGFTNQQGDHTNLIENLWMNLKTIMRSRRGIIRTKVGEFIEEFCFRRRYLRKRKGHNFKNAFNLILEHLFNE